MARFTPGRWAGASFAAPEPFTVPPAAGAVAGAGGDAASASVRRELVGACASTATWVRFRTAITASIAITRNTVVARGMKPSLEDCLRIGVNSTRRPYAMTNLECGTRCARVLRQLVILALPPSLSIDPAKASMDRASVRLHRHSPECRSVLRAGPARHRFGCSTISRVGRRASHWPLASLLTNM